MVVFLVYLSEFFGLADDLEAPLFAGVTAGTTADLLYSNLIGTGSLCWALALAGLSVDSAFDFIYCNFYFSFSWTYNFSFFSFYFYSFYFLFLSYLSFLLF